MIERARMGLAMTLAFVVTGCAGAAPSEPAAARCEPSVEGASAASEPAHEAAPNVQAGTCELEWLPAGVVVDLRPEEERDLVEQVRSWLADETRAPRIDMQHGIVLAKSEDDLGGEPPYPTSTAAQSTRACGLASVWLRDHLRARFAMEASPDFEGVRCQDNVCCFSGMEYVSDGAIVFRRASADDQPAWVIDAAYEVAEAALGEETVHANRAYVAGELARLATHGACPGEPPDLR